ncbi:hypothetical protein HYR69_07505, partial [Candidatus Sumerlaeota bacterium]|nr:hypothetical protein [Candidatus Sumerlaeota bacterium]
EELLDHSYSPLILGMDMLGEEERLPALESGQEIYACVLAEIENGKSRIHRTIHAAGLGEVRNIRDAMIMGAERIGHATRIMEDPVALEYAARRHQPVEVNLVSNVRLGYAKDYESHPFLNMLRLGLRVSLSTDDEGILDTDIVNEYLKAVTHSDVTYNELKQMTFNSIETSFAEPELREKLLADLKKDFDNFEREWSLKAGRPQSAPAGADLPAGAN